MRQWMRLALLGLFSSALIACGSDNNDSSLTTSESDSSQKTQVRVLHGAADAPPVDVLVDGTVVLSNVAYRDGSGYVEVDPGIRNIQVNPTGTQTSVIQASPELAEGTAYSLLAVGKAGDQSIEPLLLVDDATAPDAGNVKLRVVHGAPDAAPVDVYVTEPGTGLADTNPTLSNVAYKDASQYLQVPAGTYQIRVTQAGQKQAIYDSGPVSIQEGAILTTVAVPTPQSIGLVALSNDDQNPIFQLANVQDTRVRALHAVANAPSVDLLVGGNIIVSNLGYSQVTGYLNVPSGDQQVQVNPTTTTDSVIDTTATFEEGLPYTIIALGSLPDVAPLVLQDQTAGPSATDVKLRVVHAAASAPAVDVYVTPPDSNLGQATPAVSNLAFQAASDYATLQPGEYRIRVTPTGDPTVVYDSGTLTLNAGDVITAAAIPATGGTAPITLTALTNRASRSGFAIPDVNARVRAVHASPDTPPVDVLVDGQVAVSNLAFKEASAYAPVVATDGPAFTITATGTQTAILQVSPALQRGTDYTLMAVNNRADIEPLLLTDNQAPPQPGNAKVRLVHASPNAPVVDILVDGEVVASDVAFKDSSDYLQLAAGDHSVAIRDAANDTNVIETTVTVEDGGIYTVAAVNPLENLEALVLRDN